MNNETDKDDREKGRESRVGLSLRITAGVNDVFGEIIGLLVDSHVS